MNKTTEQNIPQDILDVIKKSDMFNRLEKIGNKYNLMIDQMGQLSADTRMVMLGKERSDKFVDNIAKNLEIPRDTAQNIARDINDEIFSSIRESIRKMQENAVREEVEKHISSIEKAGNMKIEKAPQSSSPQYNDKAFDREKVLKEIENPVPTRDFVEHLIENHTPESIQTEKPEQKPQFIPQNPPKQNTEEKKYGGDPYREPIE